MNPYFTKKVSVSFEEAITNVTNLLKEQGFGIITEVDVKATLHSKIDVEFRPYKILGACNPSFAYKALQHEDKAGLMMPCNVIVQEHADKTVEITLINPDITSAAFKNENLDDFACEVTNALRKVYKKL